MTDRKAGSSSQFAGFFLNAPPGILHVTQAGVCLADAEAQSEALVQSRMGEVQIATAVEAVHQELIALIAAAKPEAHQIQRRWCDYLEALVLLYPLGKLLRYFYVPAHVVLQPLRSVVPNHEP